MKYELHKGEVHAYHDHLLIAGQRGRPAQQLAAARVQRQAVRRCRQRLNRALIPRENSAWRALTSYERL